ncbi:MAG: aldo/keto reductase [Bacilli bacterium]
MEKIILNNGVAIPKLGFGVFQIESDQTTNAVLEAIDAGYRMIDTAQAYFNEEQVGLAIEATEVPREELFITTKVWFTNYGYEKTLESIAESMKKLKVDYLDLVLLHQPFGDYYGAYRALVELYNEGKVKSIGVSNFYPDRLSDIAHFSEMAPHVNQVETNVFNQQIKAGENMKKHKVLHQAWSPLAAGQNDLFENELLMEIAKKYNKSIAQVILRWLTQRDIVVLSKSINKNRMIENLNIFDFELTESEMESIKKLDTGKSQFFDHQTPDAVEYMASFPAI